MGFMLGQQKALTQVMQKRYTTGKGSGKSEREWSYKVPVKDDKDVSRIFFKCDGDRLRLGLTNEKKLAAWLLELPFKK